MGQRRPTYGSWQTSADLVSTYIEELESPNALILRRAARNLGSLPRSLICGNLQQILKSLQMLVKEEEDNVSSTEARRDAVIAMAQVCLTAGVQANGSPTSFVCAENVDDLYGALLNSMDDYGTTYQQGLLTGRVREAAMSSLLDVSLLVVSNAPELLSPNLVQHMMCCLAKQTAECCGAIAGTVFLRLLYSTESAVPHIPRREELLGIFPVDATASVNWNNPTKVLPYITQMLRLPEYRYHILLGLTGSVEGHLQSMVAELVLPHLIDCYAHGQLCMLFMELLTIFRVHILNDRVTIGFLKMLQEMLSSGYLDIKTQEHCQFCEDILDLCLRGLKNSLEFPKLQSYINVICELFRFPGEVRKKTLAKLLDLFSHHIREVRMITAVGLRKMLKMYPVFKETVLDEATNLLLMTNWGSDKQGDYLCNLQQLIDLMDHQMTL